jgi:hypothetical protein
MNLLYENVEYILVLESVKKNITPKKDKIMFREKYIMRSFKVCTHLGPKNGELTQARNIMRTM